MGLDKENTQKKYAAVRAAYEKMTNKKYKGARMYTDEFIFVKLEERFYMKPKTIEDVVYYRTSY